MKKSVVILFVALAITFFYSASYGANRYEYLGQSLDGDDYYIDTQSISYTNNQDIIKFWAKIIVSDQNRRIRIFQEKNQEFKHVLQKLSEEKDFIEIDFIQNTYRIIESLYLDRQGKVLYKIGAWPHWQNIPPDSTIEGARDVIKRIIQNNTYRSPRQPFVTPQPTPQRRIPQPRTPQPQIPLNNQEQREEYGKLLEYISWLIAQPDYPEFDRWVSQKMVQAGVTPTQVNAGIEEYIRLSGGKYSDIRAMLASWYREFYMEQYGGH